MPNTKSNESTKKNGQHRTGWNFSGKRKYAFRKYSKKPALLFERERIRLRPYLKGAKLEHVGSTAVPGLGGKNVLDEMVGVVNGSPTKLLSNMERAGYDFKPTSGEPPKRLFFERDTIYQGTHMRIHLHLVRFGSKDWKERIGFRDYLRANEAAVLEYEAVKRRAAKLAAGDKEKYMELKDAYIRKITKLAVSSRHKRAAANQT